MRITVENAIERLQAGQVVALPTETVYGLAAALKCPQAIAEIFALKGRPANNPLIVHVSAAEEIPAYVTELPADFPKLAKAFWPGPMTLVLPVRLDTVPENARAGLATAAFRVPDHAQTRAVLKDGPVLMPSANLSGRPSATSADHVEVDFGEHFPVLDGGKCGKGLESTILLWNQQEKVWTIGRLGSLPPEVFLKVLGYRPEISKGGRQPVCPGQLYRHYAPKAHLTLVQSFSEEMKGVILGFEDRKYPHGCSLFSLGSSNDPEVAAQRLYALLRKLDQEGIAKAWVDINLPEDGLWLTLKERLIKAGAVR